MNRCGFKKLKNSYDENDCSILNSFTNALKCKHLHYYFHPCIGGLLEPTFDSGDGKFELKNLDLV